jgi:hypothetical protein
MLLANARGAPQGFNALITQIKAQLEADRELTQRNQFSRISFLQPRRRAGLVHATRTHEYLSAGGKQASFASQLAGREKRAVYSAYGVCG